MESKKETWAKAKGGFRKILDDPNPPRVIIALTDEGELYQWGIYGEIVMVCEEVKRLAVGRFMSRATMPDKRPSSDAYHG